MYQQMKSILIVIASAVLLGACSGEGRGVAGDDAAGDNAVVSDTLRIGVLPTLDCLPWWVALGEGLLDSLPLPVSLATFDNSLDGDDALLRGALDGCVTDLVRGEWMRSRGAEIEYLTSTDAYWQLLSGRRARIKNVRGLKDKLVATTRHSAAAMLIDAVADSAAAEPDAVFRIQINDPRLRLKMINNNETDAAIFAEPQAAAARRGGHHVLADSRRYGWQQGVVVVTRAGLTRAGSAAALTTAYDAAVDLINDRGIRAYADILALRTGADEGALSALDSIETARKAAGSAGLFGRARAPRKSDIETANGYIKQSVAKH